MEIAQGDLETLEPSICFVFMTIHLHIVEDWPGALVMFCCVEKGGVEAVPEIERHVCQYAIAQLELLQFLKLDGGQMNITLKFHNVPQGCMVMPLSLSGVVWRCISFSALS